MNGIDQPINYPSPLDSFTLVDVPIVGLEDVQRAAFWVFFEGMSHAIGEIEGRWQQLDEEFDARVGTNFAPTVLEPIPNTNFFEGHKPSLLLGSPDSYPNLAVFATRADPGPENDRLDQMDQWLDSILVEIMVKANDETTVNRRIQRTTEAAVLCLRRNPDLGGAVTGLQTAPSVSISDVFAVRSPGQSGGYTGQDGDGGRYIWQGASINFRVPKDSVIPSSGQGVFRSTSDVDYGKYIDQG